MTFLQPPVEERVIVCQFQPRRRELGWTVSAGSVYQKTMPYIPVEVRQSTGTLTAVGATPTGNGEWFYDWATRILYVQSNDGSNPGTRTTVVEQRVCMSSRPFDFPYDGASGESVPHLAHVTGIGGFGQTMDEDNPSIALEATGVVQFMQSDAWRGLANYVTEGALALVLLVSPNGATVKQLFSGYVSFVGRDETLITMGVVDLIRGFQKRVATDLFTAGDAYGGQLLDSTFLQRKRRVYGKCGGVRLIPLDPYKDSGVDISDRFGASVSVTSGSTEGTLTTTGATDSDLLDDLLPGAQVTTGGGQVLELVDAYFMDLSHFAALAITLADGGGGVVDVTITPGSAADFSGLTGLTFDVLLRVPDTGSGVYCYAVVYGATLSSGDIVGSFDGTVGKAGLGTATIVEPGTLVVYRRDTSTSVRRLRFAAAATATETSADCRLVPANGIGKIGNLRWHIAGHTLTRLEVTVGNYTYLGSSRYQLPSVDGWQMGDVVSEVGVVVGVDEENVVLTISGSVSGLDLVREPTGAYYRKLPGTDRVQQGTAVYLPYEESGGEYLAKDLTFENPTLAHGSALLHYSYLVATDGAHGLQGQDVYADNSAHVYGAPTTWAARLTQASSKTALTRISSGLYQRPPYLADDSVVFAEVYGKPTAGGDPISTVPVVMLDLIREAGVPDASIDLPSFSDVAAIYPARVSYMIPGAIGGDAPTVREALSYVAGGIGAAVSNQAGVFTCVALDPERTALSVVPTVDIIRATVEGNSNIYTNLVASYRNQDVDTSGLEGSFKLVEEANADADILGLTAREARLSLPLYYEADATVQAQRWLAVHGRAQQTLRLVLPLRYYDTFLTDVLAVDLGLFADAMVGMAPGAFVGRVFSVSRDDMAVTFLLNDIAGLLCYAVVSADSTPDYDAASAAELVSGSFVTENDGSLGDLESTVGCNLVW